MAELQRHVGSEIGVSPWRTVTQEMIDRFAEATDDFQFIHVDPVRAAAETDFGGTVAHGFLTLSLLSAMAYETLPPLENTEIGINQGFDSLRFQSPVRTGSHIRARFFLAKVHARPSGWVEVANEVKIEIENELRPALSAKWLTLYKLGGG